MAFYCFCMQIGFLYHFLSVCVCLRVLYESHRRDQKKERKCIQQQQWHMHKKKKKKKKWQLDLCLLHCPLFYSQVHSAFRATSITETLTPCHASPCTSVRTNIFLFSTTFQKHSWFSDKTMGTEMEIFARQ